MRLDIHALQQFYAGPVGQAAHAMIERRIASVWPDANGLDVLGYGYATPWLGRLAGGARRCVAFMPAGQGVEPWPPGAGPVASTIGDEDRLPFADAVFDRCLVVHALEEASALRPLLRELWRVTAPEGRLIVIVANRTGLWSRAESTPFGHGRPFSRSQLGAALTDALFQPAAWARALYAPPLSWRVACGAAESWERTGERLWPAFGGALLVEAVKRLHVGAAPAPSRRVAFARPLAAQRSARRGPAHNQGAGDACANTNAAPACGRGRERAPIA